MHILNYYSHFLRYNNVKKVALIFEPKTLSDDNRLGRPKTATTDENIAKVHQMVLNDRPIKVREIAEASFGNTASNGGTLVCLPS